MKKEDIVRRFVKIRNGKTILSDQMAASSTLALVAAHHAGSKVLPISENPTSSSTRTEKEADESDLKNVKANALSRMKELLRWAQAAKSRKGGGYIGKKVMHFRGKGSIKGLPGSDGNLASDSPKISCSRTSSAISAYSMPHLMKVDRSGSHESDLRMGNWITTDDEFVVLEL